MNRISQVATTQGFELRRATLATRHWVKLAAVFHLESFQSQLVSLTGWISKILKSEQYSCHASLSSKRSLGEYVSSLVYFIMQYQFPKSLSDFFVFQWKPTCAGKQPDEVFVLFLMFFFFKLHCSKTDSSFFSEGSCSRNREDNAFVLSDKQILKTYIYEEAPF